MRRHFLDLRSPARNGWLELALALRDPSRSTPDSPAPCPRSIVTLEHNHIEMMSLQSGLAKTRRAARQVDEFSARWKAQEYTVPCFGGSTEFG